MKISTNIKAVFVALSFVAVSAVTKENLEQDAADLPTPVETITDKNILHNEAPTTTTVTTTTKDPTTTPPPITTSPSPPPTPKPIPAPEVGMWSFNDEKNITCIVIQLAAQWNVTYIRKDGNVPHSAVFNLPVSDTKVTNGSCGNVEQLITLSWPVTNTSDVYNNFTIYFTKNVTASKYAISKMEFDFSLNSTNFPNATAKNDSMHLKLATEIFSVPLSRSYRCTHQQAFNLTILNVADSRSIINISNVQEQAFLAEKGHSFSSAMDCDGSDVPDAVPIGVGIALAVAVLLVLIGYLIGRRRSQARGYLSM